MRSQESIYQEALQVATLYYYHGLTTEAIAKEMNFSRPKVSRLLSHARQSGMVEIRIVNVENKLLPLEQSIKDHFGLENVHIVPVPKLLGEMVWLEYVAQYAANYLNEILEPGCTLAVAWGTTISEIAVHLIPKRMPGITIVQMNGSGNTYTPDNRYAANILQKFSENYEASYLLFPVPTFFDYRETKEALFRERSIKKIIETQNNADILLYSVGAVDAGVPSHIYSSGYLEPEDIQSLEEQGVVGDLATVFFRENGTYKDIPINQRASGPSLELYKKAPRAICVVSGRAKIHGLHAALRAGYVKELIVDEPTAHLLWQRMGHSLDDL
ncbi:sugar-binding transcriptional regulator [Sediminispirochaeta smaragdinae]|uniref:Transcriptional regulator, DeoR family n=1 Tax=Sediminispirochaeta smaragdinae (strain DSM 11293 / JCM 15392 / SEBR 4228) TaxID=573413 RepID=E1R7C9_SEDSS|nr:sugar-binding transcriptional regulator [Sediminispirochaeta smaragdinae]ADK82634.1 transcriptional regulator, DeoR family [Sediminispirochaeta smaragdinae DSM 11293]